MMKMIKRKRIQAVTRERDEREDDYYIRMRIVAIWETQEAMERGVEGRSNSPIFLA
jgi:hypothetical protein